MQLRGFLGDSVRAVGFLSRFPVPSRFYEGHTAPISAMAGAFPLAGAIVALPAAMLLLVLDATGAPELLVGFLVVATQIVSSGALHEDGLADCADGLFGGRDRDRMLAIMKDSRVGSYGVLALVLAVGIRASAIAAVADAQSPLVGAVALLIAAILSRSAMVWHWSSLPQARPDGVAAAAGAPDRSARRIAVISGVALCLVLGTVEFIVPAVLLAITASAVTGQVFASFVTRKIGGHTGDTIGASQQIAEIVTLLCLALVL
ncbi:adenosylcobinamide-GDP ribazoletransferase [Ciceribacter sp. L1K22]|nr:adenosylcobinamide-GDP ribazoletransferase [Ciceribacter sp. L1K22]MBO3760726.1 adenosylcobinamide-GDP ribazoletransferase [Ciceribacter sp. L1K22]